MLFLISSSRFITTTSRCRLLSLHGLAWQPWLSLLSTSASTTTSCSTTHIILLSYSSFLPSFTPGAFGLIQLSSYYQLYGVGDTKIRIFSMHHWWYNDGISDVDMWMMAVMISYLFDVGTMLPGVPFYGFLTVAYVWRADHDQHRVLTWSMTRQRMWYDCRNCTSHTYFMMGFRLTSRLP